MTHSNLLQQGISALKTGRKAQARALLVQVVEQDKNNEQAWLWLSGAVDSDAERRACLEQVLSINPRNDVVQAGAAARPPGAAAPLSPQAALAPLARLPSPTGVSAFDATGNPARPSAAPTRRFNWLLGLGVALALLASALSGDGAQGPELVAVQAFTQRLISSCTDASPAA